MARPPQNQRSWALSLKLPLFLRVDAETVRSIRKGRFRQTRLTGSASRRRIGARFCSSRSSSVSHSRLVAGILRVCTDVGVIQKLEDSSALTNWFQPESVPGDLSVVIESRESLDLYRERLTLALQELDSACLLLRRQCSGVADQNWHLDLFEEASNDGQVVVALGSDDRVLLLLEFVFLILLVGQRGRGSAARIVEGTLKKAKVFAWL